MSDPELFVIIAFSFLLSVLSAFFISYFGCKLSIVDVPNERSSHIRPTPRAGAIGIWLSFIVVGILNNKEFIFNIIAGSIGLLGVLEDRFAIPVKIRFSLQLLLSVLAIILFKGLPFSAGALGLLLFFLMFIAGTTNFFNFMDGIDGIAGLTGIVGFGLMAFFSYLLKGEADIWLMCMVLVFACLGFLPFNFPKAKAFMGDVGSVFLGFVFASFVVKMSVNLNVFLCLIMFLCTFYGDPIVTIFYRWRRGENLMNAHRSHLYQYMSNEMKIPHWKVSLGYASVQVIFGALALVAYTQGLLWQIVLFGIFGILFVIAYRQIKKQC